MQRLFLHHQLKAEAWGHWQAVLLCHCCSLCQLAFCQSAAAGGEAVPGQGWVEKTACRCFPRALCLGTMAQLCRCQLVCHTQTHLSRNPRVPMALLCPHSRRPRAGQCQGGANPTKAGGPRDLTELTECIRSYAYNDGNPRCGLLQLPGAGGGNGRAAPAHRGLFSICNMFERHPF